MKRIHLILLSVFSGLIMSAGWPAQGFPLLLFVGFVPLLFIEDHISKQRTQLKQFNRFSVFFYSYPAFFTWNILTTWWIYNSTATGAVVAFICNSLFMAVVFSLFHATKRLSLSPVAGYLSLIAYWITFEYIHQAWEISWPWLNLGNGFASQIQLIQWYEYTGIFGGSLWILLANIMVFFMLKKTSFFTKKINLSFWALLTFLIVWITIPILISKNSYHNYREAKDPVDVVVVQPNLDPYGEQYWLSTGEVMGRVFSLADKKAEKSTDFIICPESTIQERPLYESELVNSTSYNLLHDYIQKFNNLYFVIGASTYKIFREGEPLTHTARKFHDAEKYYDAYNTALMIDSAGEVNFYHKSRLTPGVEIMPYSKYLGFIKNVAIDLGGTVGSLGTDKYRIPFTIPSKSIKVAPLICYESIYGEYCTQFIRNGANLIFVITNDGWWGNTPGHRQHLTFSSLRAIEARRSIARSANTGISAFIDQRGVIHQATEYWAQDAIRQSINANDTLTYYVKNGDYIARVASFLSVLLLLITFSTAIIKRKTKSRIR